MFLQTKPSAREQLQEPHCDNAFTDEGVARDGVSPEADIWPPKSSQPGAAATHTLASIFGLDPRAAALVVVVDLVLFGAEVVSAGILVPVAIIASIPLGFAVYRIQRGKRGDSHRQAMQKAVLLSLLTAVPFPISGVLAAMSAASGVTNKNPHD